MWKYKRPKSLNVLIETMEGFLNHSFENYKDLLTILEGIKSMNVIVNQELTVLTCSLHTLPVTEEGRKALEEDIRLLKKYRILTWVAGRQIAEIRDFVMEQFVSFDVFENKLTRMTGGVEQVESRVIRSCTDFTTPVTEHLHNIMKILQDRA